MSSLLNNFFHAEEEDGDEEVNPALLDKHARHLNKTLDKFWKRWREEYLLELRDSHRHSSGNPKVTPVSIVDVVIAHNKDRP